MINFRFRVSENELIPSGCIGKEFSKYMHAELVSTELIIIPNSDTFPL